MPYLYLGISVVFVTLFALGYKVAARWNCEMRAVNLWMNISATTLLAVSFVIDGARMSLAAGVLGTVSGVFTYLSTLSFLYHMRKGSLAVSWTVISLAVAFPVAASILFWHEHPTPKQWVGLALIPVALVLSAPGRERKEQL